jgi:hypothetical protein
MLEITVIDKLTIHVSIDQYIHSPKHTHQIMSNDITSHLILGFSFYHDARVIHIVSISLLCKRFHCCVIYYILLLVTMFADIHVQGPVTRRC